MSKLQTWWAESRDSLWLVPMLLTLGAVVLAVVTIWIDERWIVGSGIEFRLLFGGGPEGAREILGAIAGSLITVTGVVFSITIVALQLASTQYAPRVLRNFTTDRANQTVLGVFIGTFTYALLVLRRVRTGETATDTFVPALSTAVAIALTLVSVAFLIFFIDHVARSINPAVIVENIARDSIAMVERLFPAAVGQPADGAEAVDEATPEEPPAVIRARSSGYLQSVDEDKLFDLADAGAMVVRIETAMGTFIQPGTDLASVWPAQTADESLERRIRDTFVIGSERTPYQDVERGLIELSDIAIRALSTSINDPTTAMLCIDRIGQVLAAFGNREHPSPVRAGGDGRLRVIARRQEFEHSVDIAFSPIRHYGAGTGAVLARMLETIGRVAVRVPEPRRRPLGRQFAATIRTARRTIVDPLELAAVERAAEHAREHVGPFVDPHSTRAAAD